jgi:hypothetical protein
MSDNISALSTSMRPVDALSSAGLGQLISLVAPLQAVLDRMEGNASGVHAFLDSWVTVSNRINQIQGQLGQAVASGTAGWRGASADQYRTRADSFARSLAEFASAAKEAAAVVQLTAEVVGQSRSSANDLINEMVQRLISLVRHLMALEGGMTATVLAQAGALVSTFAKPVANIEKQAQTSVANAAKPINNLMTIIGAITRLWDSFAQPQASLTLASASMSARAHSDPGATFAQRSKDPELVAHELAHVVQHRGANMEAMTGTRTKTGSQVSKGKQAGKDSDEKHRR